MPVDFLEVDPSRRAQRYDAAVAAALPAASGLLAVLCVALAVVYPVVLTGHDALVMTAVSASSALALAALCAWTGRVRVPPRFAHPLALCVAAVCAAGADIHLAVSHDPAQTSVVMLVLVGAGAWVLAPLWLAVTALALWAGWLGALLTVPDPGLGTWASGMTLATLLAVAVNAARRRSIDRLGEAVDAAERVSVEDGLTGLLNRRGLSLVGEQIVATARRAGNAVHCTFLDVTGMDEVNGRYGHAAGDRALVAVADALRASVRGGDVVARWGGDEFCVLGAGPGVAPIELERRVHARLDDYPAEGVGRWEAAISAGSAMLAPWDDGDLTVLLEAADREMYRRRALRRRQPWPRAAADAGAVGDPAE